MREMLVGEAVEKISLVLSTVEAGGKIVQPNRARQFSRSAPWRDSQPLRETPTKEFPELLPSRYRRRRNSSSKHPRSLKERIEHRFKEHLLSVEYTVWDTQLSADTMDVKND